MDKSNKDFENLIKKDKYQVFVFCCPSYLPHSLFKHPWFVLNKKGVISRWEVKHFINEKNLNHLFIDDRVPFQGVGLTYCIEKYFWKSEFLGLIEGDENSTAQKAIEFIENSEKTYPYCDRYFFLGPNSNTYVQNVLNKFPEFNIKLSWHFIGKDFHIKNDLT